jgi:hypothetical protein
VIEVDDPSAGLTSLLLHWGYERSKALDVAATARGNALPSVADRGLPERQHPYRARLLRQTMESCVLPAAPPLRKSTVSSSSISSGGNRSTSQYPDTATKTPTPLQATRAFAHSRIPACASPSRSPMCRQFLTPRNAVVTYYFHCSE